MMMALSSEFLSSFQIKMIPQWLTANIHSLRCLRCSLSLSPGRVVQYTNSRMEKWKKIRFSYQFQLNFVDKQNVWVKWNLILSLSSFGSWRMWIFLRCLNDENSLFENVKCQRFPHTSRVDFKVVKCDSLSFIFYYTFNSFPPRLRKM